MYLAEALVLRADAQKRLAQLQQRLQRVAKVQEGDRPAEEPDSLIAEFEEAAAELEGLIRQINRTNLDTRLPSGATLTDALAARDVLRLRAELYRGLAAAAAIQYDRGTRSEVKFVSTVDVRAIQKRADALQKEHRELDAEIQAANWRTPLAEAPMA